MQQCSQQGARRSNSDGSNVMWTAIAVAHSTAPPQPIDAITSTEQRVKPTNESMRISPEVTITRPAFCSARHTATRAEWPRPSSSRKRVNKKSV